MLVAWACNHAALYVRPLRGFVAYAVLSRPVVWASVHCRPSRLAYAVRCSPFPTAHLTSIEYLMVQNIVRIKTKNRRSEKAIEKGFVRRRVLPPYKVV